MKIMKKIKIVIPHLSKFSSSSWKTHKMIKDIEWDKEVLQDS